MMGLILLTNEHSEIKIFVYISQSTVICLNLKQCYIIWLSCLIINRKLKQHQNQLKNQQRTRKRKRKINPRVQNKMMLLKKRKVSKHRYFKFPLDVNWQTCTVNLEVDDPLFSIQVQRPQKILQKRNHRKLFTVFLVSFFLFMSYDRLKIYSPMSFFPWGIRIFG